MEYTINEVVVVVLVIIVIVSLISLKILGDKSVREANESPVDVNESESMQPASKSKKNGNADD